MEKHTHEWIVTRVLLLRDWQLSYGSRPVQIRYKRCNECGMVLL